MELYVRGQDSMETAQPRVGERGRRKLWSEKRDLPRMHSPCHMEKQGSEADLCPLPFLDHKGGNHSEPQEVPPRTLKPWVSTSQIMKLVCELSTVEVHLIARIFPASSDKPSQPPMAFQGWPLIPQTPQIQGLQFPTAQPPRGQELSAGQWLSAQGNFVPHGPLTLSGDISVVTTGVGRCFRH